MILLLLMPPISFSSADTPPDAFRSRLFSFAMLFFFSPADAALIFSFICLAVFAAVFTLAIYAIFAADVCFRLFRLLR